MFSTTELGRIDESYFSVISKGAFTVTLMSKNTGHCWHMLLQEYCGRSSVLIYHSHVYGTPYHLHGHAGSLANALFQIRKHDDYQINFRDKRHRRRRSKHKQTS